MQSLNWQLGFIFLILSNLELSCDPLYHLSGHTDNGCFILKQKNPPCITTPSRLFGFSLFPLSYPPHIQSAMCIVFVLWPKSERKADEVELGEPPSLLTLCTWNPKPGSTSCRYKHSWVTARFITVWTVRSAWSIYWHLKPSALLLCRHLELHLLISLAVIHPCSNN